MSTFEYGQIDAGVRKLVWLLREQCGFNTTDSGDGSKAGSMECALDVPHVHMECSPNLFRRMSHDLLGVMHDRLKPEAWSKLEPHAIQFVYSPIDGAGTLSLYGICDEDLAVQP